MFRSSSVPWDVLMSACQDSKEVVIAAPYIKASSLRRLLAIVPSEAELTCVSRWTPQDIRSGATDLACRDLVLRRDGDFLLNDRLHAKYYRFDTCVLVGSANLTQAGMSIDIPGSLEILCAAPPEFEVPRFEHSLLQEAYPVSDADFMLWNQIATVQMPEEETSTFNSINGPVNWKPVTRRPEYLWLAYRNRTNEIPSGEQQEISSSEIRLLSIPQRLTEPEFKNWIKLSLLTSPFIKSVLDSLEQPREAAWDRLAQQWGISKAEADRSRSTALNWIAYFGLNLQESMQPE